MEAKKTTGPLRTEVDLQKPVALTEENYGAMILPQKGMTSDSICPAADGEIVPLGQLWLKGLAPMRNGQCVSSDELRLLTVEADGDVVTVPLCALGVRRKSADALELVIFGKGKEPLLAAPLKASTASHAMPVDLAAERGEESGRITVKILGKYSASFEVTELQI